MKTYTVTYNLTLTIEVQADSEDEATVSCRRTATSIAPWFAIASRRQLRGRTRATTRWAAR